MKKNFVKLLCAVLVLCFAVCGLTACGAQTVKLTVNDMGQATEIEASTDMTVAQALEKASLTLGEKDETEPAKDTKITESVKEINVKRYAKVTVVSGSDKKEVELVGGTVEDAITKAGYTAAGELMPDAPLTDFVKDGMIITMVKSIKVEITADGKTIEASTTMATVDALLKEQKISLGADDECNEKLDAKVTEGMKIVIKRVTFKEVKEKEKVDYETEEKYSDSLDKGATQVTQEGAEGEKEVTYKVKYVDGVEESREKVSETVTKEPVKKIVTIGTKASGGSGDSGSGDSGSGDSGSGDSGSDDGGVHEVSRTDVPDCDGSGHGYYIVKYSDGHEEYEEY